MSAPLTLKPPPLRPGDTIGLVAPASPDDPALVAAGIARLQAQGFNIALGLTAQQKWRYLSGPDAQRAKDINIMFTSPEIRGIMCIGGGYGSMRILEMVDYDAIRAHPKIFVGYSDITALHLAIAQRTGLVTFHGPMLVPDIAGDMPPYTWDSFYQAVTATTPLGLVGNPPRMAPPRFIVPGTARGPLVGGNLSLIAAMLGTPYEIDTTGKILCLEEVGEAPYRLDRMLTQLLLAGKLQAAAGIVVAVCADCDADRAADSFTVNEVLYNRLGDLGKPVLTNLYFGHTPDKATLPWGVMAVLDKDIGGLAVVEAATAR